jgi:hypothetical protein
MNLTVFEIKTSKWCRPSSINPWPIRGSWALRNQSNWLITEISRWWRAFIISHHPHYIIREVFGVDWCPGQVTGTRFRAWEAGRILSGATGRMDGHWRMFEDSEKCHWKEQMWRCSPFSQWASALSFYTDLHFFRVIPIQGFLQPSFCWKNHGLTLRPNCAHTNPTVNFSKGWFYSERLGNHSCWRPR